MSYPGALKATKNSGLQPAMDHIIENESKPVPDPNATSTTTASSTTQQSSGDRDALNEDDDEDLEALKAVYGPTATSSSGEAEAKVRANLKYPRSFLRQLIRALNVPNAGKYSKILHWLISTQKKAGMIDLKSRQKRHVFFLNCIICLCSNNCVG
jgi:hypothetical protein